MTLGVLTLIILAIIVFIYGNVLFVKRFNENASGLEQCLIGFTLGVDIACIVAFLIWFFGVAMPWLFTVKIY